ncbi:hypothetical protein [Muricoccus radiodurans]|uniref:hypothetical protein n=1 Tax=Muricoccus radiodurans TaxID=2231721 RepID=UPI003CF6F0B1
MTPEQCREARELLGWTALLLAEKAGMHDVTVRSFEQKKKPTLPKSMTALRATLEAAGAEFAADGAGVQLANTHRVITPEQCRAARSLLGWNRQRLAVRADLSTSTVIVFEAGKRPLLRDARTALRKALEAAGVELIAENGGGSGVRLRKDLPPP